MQLISFLFQKLDDDAKNAMAQAIQATPSELEKGLNQLSRLFLGVLVHPPLNRIQVENIQKVVEEGGHTGELLSNLPSLLADEQRSSLLIDIGTKIFQHFYEGDIDTLLEKLIMVLGIRKSVIQAILGLTPPLVLGTLGIQMRKERWGTADLQTYLENQQSDIEGELSPYLTPHISSRSQIPTTVEENPPKKDSKKSTKKSTSFPFFMWLPWILLGLLAIASWWYLNKLQKGDQIEAPLADSLSVLSDDTNFDQLEQRMNQPADSTQIKAAPAPVIEEKVVTKPIESTESNPQAQKVSTPKAETSRADGDAKGTKKVETTTSSNTTGSNKTTKSTASNVSSSLRMTFQSGSAEIKDDQVLRGLAETWKVTKAGSLVISGNFSNRLTEDQAYAIRERLFQLGVPLSFIRLEKSNSALQILQK